MVRLTESTVSRNLLSAPTKRPPSFLLRLLGVDAPERRRRHLPFRLRPLLRDALPSTAATPIRLLGGGLERDPLVTLEKTADRGSAATGIGQAHLAASRGRFEKVILDSRRIALPSS